MMDIATGLAAANQAIEMLKTLRDANKALSEAEYKMQIADLMGLLSDAKISLAEARSTMAEKDAEIARLAEIQSSKAKTVFYNGFNFGITPDGEPMGLPFCTACEKKGDQIQLVHLANGYYNCPICQSPINNPPKALPRDRIPAK